MKQDIGVASVLVLRWQRSSRDEALFIRATGGPRTVGRLLAAAVFAVSLTGHNQSVVSPYYSSRSRIRAYTWTILAAAMVQRASSGADGGQFLL